MECGTTKSSSIPKLTGSTSSSGSDTTAYVSQFISFVNEERAKNNLPALAVNTDLANYAQTRALELAETFPNNFGHTRPDGSSATEYINKELKYKYFGEILCTKSTPEEALQQFMNFSDTSRSILNEKLTYTGVACYFKDGQYIWVQEFGGK